jgi:hypothetical protein
MDNFKNIPYVGYFIKISYFINMKVFKNSNGARKVVFIYCVVSIKICINECECPWLWETWRLRNLNLVWHLAEHWVSLTKECYGAEILHGPRHLNCGWKIDKSNKKKYEGKKAHAEDRTQTSSGLTAKFKFLSQVSHKQRHPHPLIQILIDVAQYCID